MASSLSHLECSQVHQVDSPSAKREAQPAETVVRLIEELRGHPYPPAERSRELKAAFTLLNLKEAPHLGLEEIREAWEHGSDDWWRATYGDDVHVHDLIRRNKRGVRWVLAFLDHKRKENRKPSTAMEAPYVPVHEILSPPPTEMSETYEFLASEAEAVALASRIERDGQVYGYAISAHTEEDEYHPGIWYVQIEWWIDAERMKTHRVSSWQAWERYILQQHKILQYNAVPA